MFDSNAAIWTGRILSGLAIAFLLAASVAPKLMQAKTAADTFTRLGWSTDYLLLIGMIELGCILLYAWPKTSVLGAVLTTGLLGGAIATQLRVGSPVFSHTLFGLYVGFFIWGGLWLRDPALRALFPWKY
ncbi:DoxX family protein [Sphingopyxis kveilinensis]|uniref:DoxX family protein n=1 Tax=Sphingopyxis kveilinensis TaxID=3114367 RepID=UPI0030D0AA57